MAIEHEAAAAKRSVPYSLRALLILSFWQIRQVKLLFMVATMGILLAIVLVSAVPMLTSVNMTASARAAFTNQPYDPSSSLQTRIDQVTASTTISQMIQQAELDYHQSAAPFFDLPPDISLHLDNNFIYKDKNSFPLSQQVVEVHGYTIAHIASHVQVLQGRLPRSSSKAGPTSLEVAMTANNAIVLNAHIGSTYTIYITENPITTSLSQNSALLHIPVRLQVVGILRDQSDAAFDTPFWHGDNLNYQPAWDTGPANESVVASNNALLALFDQLSTQSQEAMIVSDANISLYFPLDIHAITDKNIGQLQRHLDYLTNKEPDQLTYTFTNTITISNTALTTMNSTVSGQTIVAQIPLLAMTGLMLGLIFFFVTLMTDLLVTRQAEAISIMRSRGATIYQVFLIFALQSLLLSLLAIVLGLLLVSPTVRLLIIVLHVSSIQSALDVLPTSPWQIVLATGAYLWITLILAVLTMFLSIWRTLKNSLAGRSLQQGTTVQRPFWQRIYADLFITLLGALIYGLYTYISSTGSVTPQVQVLLAGPCMFITATLLCLAGALLFLRLFPRLLQLMVWLASQGRGIVPLFAFVVLARAPRQTMRTVLLLIFTLAFALFAQVFLATQQQRTADVTNYITSADFSGQVLAENITGSTLKQQERRYQQIPGVLSATLGYVSNENFLNTDASITVIATDPTSFVNSVNWPQADNQTQIKSLLPHLTDQQKALSREEANAQVYKPATPIPLPAIVSVATKNLLHLSVGTTFFLAGTGDDAQMPLVDIGEVPSLPGVSDITQNLGVLVDYNSFSLAYNATINQGAALSPTTAWLHARSDAASLNTIQHILGSGSLALIPLISRHAILKQLQNDPLLLNMLYICILGIALTLLLAWTGCLISAWLHMRTRLRSLLTLVALGTTPTQLMLLLSWEQIILYGTALLIGLACGAGFTALALPAVVFSNTASLGSVITTFTTDIFQLQFTPPLHIIIPSSVFISLLLTFLLLLLSIAIPTILILRLSPAQMLRLSEDYLEEAPLPPERQQKPAQDSDRHALTGRRAVFLQEMRLRHMLSSFRRAWPLLGLTQLGVLISVLFVCVVPLFSQVAATAGLHDVLIQPENRYATTTSTALNVVPLQHMQKAITQATNVINRELAGPATAYFNTPPIVSLNNVQLSSTGPSSSATVFSYDGLSQQSLPGQFQLLQGHIPQAGNRFLQILLTPAAATYLHAHIGTVLPAKQEYPLDMQVVGLFRDPGTHDPWFPTTNFFFYSDPNNHTRGVVTALVPTEGLEMAVSAFGRTRAASKYSLNGSVTWYYALHEQIPATQLDDLVAALSSLHLIQGILAPGSLTVSPISTPLDVLQQYQQSVLIARIPIICVSVLIIMLVLLFLSFIVHLLVEHEAPAIAIMRSRGATSRQIFAAFLARTFLINAIAFLMGIALTIPGTILLTRLTLQPGDQSGLDLFTAQPLLTFWTLVQYALGSIVITQLALSLALLQAMRSDALSLRRESGRTTRKPFWQRLYLDVIGIIITLAASGFSLYLANTTISSPQVNVLVKAPLVLTATISLVVTSILLLSRLFPLLLRIGTQLAQHNRGVAPILALSQMARTPRRNLHIALLLLLTSAFVVFVLIFAASQNQHIDDVAQYWAGTDFSGSFPVPLSLAQAGKVQQAYQRIKGMNAVTLGDVEMLSTVSNETTVKMVAVDPQRFFHTLDWPEIHTHAQQQTLIAKLQDPLHIPELESLWINAPDHSIPALVDAHLWQALQLTVGQSFLLNSPTGPISFFAVQEVTSIPTTHDQGQETQDFSAPAGILVDFQHYNAVYHTLTVTTNTPTGENASLNSAWLKTDGKALSLQRVRQSVETGPLQLSTFYDRQASTQALLRDPLILNLFGILVLGSISPLLLALVGCLLSSWIDIQQRHLLFGVLRALGSTPGQLARVLAWEQGLIFGTAISLGTLCGLVAASLALPSLVLTSVLPHLSSSHTEAFINEVQDLFSLQNIPPAQMIVPQTVIGVVLLLVGLGTLLLIIVVRSASLLALAQTLRLNED